MADVKAVPLHRDVISIFKLRIGATIMLSAIGGIAVTPGIAPQAWQIVALAIAVFMASASAGAFNQWAEAGLDRQMRRTAQRPFATGRLKPGIMWLSIILGLLAVSVALAAWATNGWAAFHTFMGAFIYGIVYTLWLKRRTTANIVVGGLAGSFAVLAGAAAVNPSLQPEPVILALVLFLWTPPHFWSLAIAANEDYASASVPMLPVLHGSSYTALVILGHTLLLVSLSLLPLFWSMGWVYLIGAASGGAIFIWTSIRLVFEPTRKRAIKNFLASLLQLALLLGGAIVERLAGAI